MIRVQSSDCVYLRIMVQMLHCCDPFVNNTVLLFQWYEKNENEMGLSREFMSNVSSV